ncbi:glycerate kinase [Leucobacter viscericola]|uniref:Glycerate kinase n=1 Tax=Leucobacter viscericola TaxID=2714935 RepID=A0A6G7XFN0_9MICO|nr:glycerate kinase [Leucobacter viscericola]QIK63276.1 glycerate kinase [Leucobacter viscericola]
MSRAALKIVVAPDSFKGSCSAAAAAGALADGARSALGAACEVVEIPLADGGEGTLDALVSAWDGRVTSVPSSDALGRPRTGRVGFRGSGSGGGVDRTSAGRLAIIEAADANGLPWVSDQPLRALDADSYGVGLLILAALDAGVDEVLLCIGGSATSDGGAGMLRALGARLLDSFGDEVAPGARGLTDLARIDLADFDARARAVKWRIACDVDNPLIGSRGAAAVFGPQKGAGTAEVAEIDAGLERLAALLRAAGAAHSADLMNRPGLGAAGGLALGLVALCGAELVPGAELVSEVVGLREALASADLVLTGEGRFDAQSLDGKVVSSVVAAAAGRVPVVVIAGSVALSAAETRQAGVTAAFSIAQGPATLAELQEHCLELLAEAAAQITPVILREG